ncbi:site-specific DNA-methyltransferase [Leptothrix sp. BB-4]
MPFHTIQPGAAETLSADLKADNLARLRALFPELATEGPGGPALDVDVLRALIGDAAVGEGVEKYGLSWHGKRAARRLALTPSSATLRPCRADSVDWDSTRNLMIEGDNLEVLKLLQRSYAGKVKLIYIDPPYNTGKDFVYPDNFQDSIRNYLELTGQLDGGRKITTNSESSGRFHTDWLNMMYPRLKLAHSLLKDDGVIFVSIADHEVHNLRSVMDEIFGGENFIASVIWQKVYAPKSSARHFSEDHDYLLVYAKNSDEWVPNLLPRTAEQDSIFKNMDNDSRGAWRANNMAARNYYSKGTYPIRCPGGRVIDGPPRGSYWRISEEKFKELDRDKRIWWGLDGNNVPAPKIFLSEVMDGRVPQTLWTYQEVGHTQEAKRELLSQVEFSNSDVVFETPKPTRLIKRILQLATKATEADLVLDFFAGTGTTMDAVYAQNAEDGGNRRCILVQLPEAVEGMNEQNWRSVADITRARIKAAGQRQKDGDPLFTGDVGFKAFRLDTSNFTAWNPKVEALGESLFEQVEHVVAGRSEDDLLHEVLLKHGHDLCEPVRARELGGKVVQRVGGKFVCLAAHIGRDDAEPVALGIVEWLRDEPEEGERSALFRDGAFEDDVAKANLAAILEQHGLKRMFSL